MQVVAARTHGAEVIGLLPVAGRTRGSPGLVQADTHSFWKHLRGKGTGPELFG